MGRVIIALLEVIYKTNQKKLIGRKQNEPKNNIHGIHPYATTDTCDICKAGNNRFRGKK